MNATTSLSPLASRTLVKHALKRGYLWYATDALGSMFNDASVERLDAAYEELVRSELMEPADETFTYFGDVKRYHRLTPAGWQAVEQVAA